MPKRKAKKTKSKTALTLKLTEEQAKDLYFALSEYMDRHDAEGDIACGECLYYECKKNAMKDMLLPKYRDFNVIDDNACKKKNMELYPKLVKIMAMFPWAYNACDICGKKLFAYDIDYYKDVGSFLIPDINFIYGGEVCYKMVTTCKKCKAKTAEEMKIIEHWIKRTDKEPKK